MDRWRTDSNMHLVYTAGEWRNEVANGDTELGYHEWVEHMIESNKIDWFAVNAERDLWFKEPAEDGSGWNCYLFPKDWAQEFSQPGFAAEGPDDPELYGYCPARTYANAEVETMYVLVRKMGKMIEVTEEEARTLHPKLAEYLDKIDRGEPV